MKNFAVLFTFVLSVVGVAATLEATAAESVRVEQAFVLPFADADAADGEFDNKRKKRKKRDGGGGEEDEEELRLARCSRGEAQKSRGM